MNKILFAMMILFAVAAGGTAQAQSAPENGKSPLKLNHAKKHFKGRHPQKTKPVRKVAGSAERGAKQVSPLVLPQDK
jgi:hypothetical protein